MKQTLTAICISVIIGSCINMAINHLVKPKMAKATYSEWSTIETIRPSPPFPQWVIIQYRTNLADGEVASRIVAHSQPRDMMEPDSVQGTP